MKDDLKAIFGNMRTHLMNGVSYMIPVVVAGGVLMAISLIMTGQAQVPETGFSKMLWDIGATGLGVMVPVLSGYIAFSMADRAGLAPGLIGGMLASNIGAGFLGGIVSGILAGIVCFYLKKIKLPVSLKSLGSIIIVPIVGTLIVGLVMVGVIGAPIAALMENLKHFLTSMTDGNKLILGLIMGAMVAFDMGGPVNKVVFGLMVATIGSGIYTIGGPVGAAICIPPFGLGLATFLFKNKFTKTELEAGKSALVMGIVGITEGAIPFAAADPLRVIPSIMIGSAIGSATGFMLNTANHAAWGGLIVLPVVENKIGYFISVAVGTIVTAVMVGFLKKPVAPEVEEVDDDEDDDVFMEMNF